MDNTQRYTYGTVLLLEQEQDENYWNDCCRKMCSLHMNTVVVWPPVFYVDGERDYSVQKRFLDVAQMHGLDVVVELTGQIFNLEYLPDCAYKDEYAVVNADGKIEKMQNGLGELNYNHPEVKSALKEFFRDTVEALKEHEALAGWDVWNETHFKSYDEYTFCVFQSWLERKYGTIGKLNASWKKSYNAFNQVRHDPVTWASIMPDCDWEEFRTDNLAEISASWTGWIKEFDGKHPTTADNVMSNAVWGEFDRGTDDWKVAASADRYGISFYPKTGGRLLPDNTAWLRCLTFAAAAAAGKGSFIVSEMQSHYYSEIFTTERVTSEDIVNWNLEALSQGCAGCIYWKWAPFKTGFQLGGRGLVLADGSLSKRSGAAEKIGKLVKDNPQLNSLKPYASAAVLYDRENNFTVKAINNRVKHIIGDDQPVKARYGLYRLCWENNIPLSVIIPEELEGLYEKSRVLFVPYQVSLSEESCNAVRAFVNAGGTLVANYPFVDIDSNGRLYEALPGGPLNDLIGATHLDNLVADGEEIQQLAIDDGADVICELAGDPLIFRRKVGAGQVFYIATALWNAAHDGNDDNAKKILGVLLNEIPEICPADSELNVVLTEGKDADYLFVGNYQELAGGSVKLKNNYKGYELIFGDCEVKFEGNILSFNNLANAVIRLGK